MPDAVSLLITYFGCALAEPNIDFLGNYFRKLLVRRFFSCYDELTPHPAVMCRTLVSHGDGAQQRIFNRICYQFADSLIHQPCGIFRCGDHSCLTRRVS